MDLTDTPIDKISELSDSEWRDLVNQWLPDIDIPAVKAMLQADGTFPHHLSENGDARTLTIEFPFKNGSNHRGFVIQVASNYIERSDCKIAVLKTLNVVNDQMAYPDNLIMRMCVFLGMPTEGDLHSERKLAWQIGVDEETWDNDFGIFSDLVSLMFNSLLSK